MFCHVLLRNIIIHTSTNHTEPTSTLLSLVMTVINSDTRRQFWMEELLVCTWRHTSHVGGQEQKHFSPLGNKIYFHVNSLRQNSLVLTPNMSALSRSCKPRTAIVLCALYPNYFGWLPCNPWHIKKIAIPSNRPEKNAKQSCNLSQKIPMKFLLPHPCHLLGCLHPSVFWNFWTGYIACLIITGPSIASSLTTRAVSTQRHQISRTNREEMIDDVISHDKWRHLCQKCSLIPIDVCST